MSEVVNEAQTLASSVATNAQDAVRRVAEEHKTAAAAQVDEAARALDTAADTVERVLPQAAPYVREAASGIHRVSDAVRSRSIDDILAMVVDFGRAQPAVWLGGSVLAGFALARFLKSSADRRMDMATHSGSSRGPSGAAPRTAGASAASGPDRSR